MNPPLFGDNLWDMLNKMKVIFFRLKNSNTQVRKQKDGKQHRHNNDQEDKLYRVWFFFLFLLHKYHFHTHMDNQLSRMLVLQDQKVHMYQVGLHVLIKLKNKKYDVNWKKTMISNNTM